MKFKKKDFEDLWDHIYATTLNPSMVAKVVKRANEILNGDRQLRLFDDSKDSRIKKG